MEGEVPYILRCFDDFHRQRGFQARMVVCGSTDKKCKNFNRDVKIQVKYMITELMRDLKEYCYILRRYKQYIREVIYKIVKHMNMRKKKIQCLKLTTFMRPLVVLSVYWDEEDVICNKRNKYKVKQQTKVNIWKEEESEEEDWEDVEWEEGEEVEENEEEGVQE